MLFCSRRHTEMGGLAEVKKGGGNHASEGQNEKGKAKQNTPPCFVHRVSHIYVKVIGPKDRYTHRSVFDTDMMSEGVMSRSTVLCTD